MPSETAFMGRKSISRPATFAVSICFCMILALILHQRLVYSRHVQHRRHYHAHSGRCGFHPVCRNQHRLCRRADAAGFLLHPGVEFHGQRFVSGSSQDGRIGADQHSLYHLSAPRHPYSCSYAFVRHRGSRNLPPTSAWFDVSSPRPDLVLPLPLCYNEAKFSRFRSGGAPG